MVVARDIVAVAAVFEQKTIRKGNDDDDDNNNNNNKKLRHTYKNMTTATAGSSNISL